MTGKHKGKLASVSAQEMVQMLNLKNTIAEVAREYGVQASSITQFNRRNNIVHVNRWQVKRGRK